MADENKISFIICTNDELQLQECLMYLNLLHIPEGYQTEVITVTDAVSMASGYNEAMRTSDAKYKIYLHQDTFIIEYHFLDRLLKIFKKDKAIGMLGMVGAETLSKDGVMWHEQRCGGFYRLEEFVEKGTKANLQRLKKGIKEVEAVDGFLMATQYDLPWREDIFHGFDFYDVSQCMEFRRAGYKIVVPSQKTELVIHSSGCLSLWNYNMYREALLKEYPEIAFSRKAQKRILFLHSKQIQLIGIPFALVQLGHRVDISNTEVSLGNTVGLNLEVQELLEEELEEGHYDLAVTYDFCREVSNACQNSHIPYYAWVYDSPLMDLYSKEALNEMNYISVFDRKQYGRLSLLGLKHLFYLPLAPEIDNFGAVHIGKRDEKKYSCDISFVGRLYKNRGFEQIFYENSKIFLEEAESLIRQMDCTWNTSTTIFDKASEELISYMASKQQEDTWKAWNVHKRFFCESMKLARKCNETERIHLLKALEERFHIVVYADDSAKEILKDLTVKPWLDYGSEMPKVFHLSKINLNITSRSIESGIPQRVWDILAVGGFCLTNYQPELDEYFEVGKDLEVYHNLEELEDKIAYYLTHEKERLTVAINGYKRIKDHHSLKARLRQALDFIMEEECSPL